MNQNGIGIEADVADIGIEADVADIGIPASGSSVWYRSIQVPDWAL
jgi:hypothetical protein